MPAIAPDELTDSRERAAFYEISRVYEEFCGYEEDKHLWPERTKRFQVILSLANRILNENRNDQQK